VAEEQEVALVDAQDCPSEQRVRGMLVASLRKGSRYVVKQGSVGEDDVNPEELWSLT
jgi:hypothetical protein